MSKQGCTADTGDTWHQHRCGKALKTVEQVEAGLCGIHLAAKQRRVAAAAKRASADAVSKARKADAARACERLEAMGVQGGRPEWEHRRGCYTGMVVLDPEELFAVLDAARERQ
jgi:hypothetical protein